MLALRKQRNKEGNENQSDELLLFQLNENYELVDSLPYVDSYNDELRDEVKGLIQSEMETFQPSDYLKYLLPPVTPLLDSVFEKQRLIDKDGDSKMGENNKTEEGYLWPKEIERLMKQTDPFQKLDMSRYDCPQPTNTNDLCNWKKTLNNVKAQVRHDVSKMFYDFMKIMILG